MKSSSLTTIAALAIIGTGGFMAGRISSSDTSKVDSDGPVETRSSRSSSQSGAVAGGGPSTKSQRPERAERASAGTSAERVARLDSIIRNENPLDRSRALLAYIDQLAPGDFEEAVAYFRSLGITDSRNGDYAMLLSGWAQVDPMAALAYAKENTRGGFATNTILTTWASTDPEGAIRWAEANHEGDDANPYMTGIIRSLAATDPSRATTLLTGMPRSRERGDALDAMLPHLLTQGNEATRAWIEGISDESLRSGAMLRVAEKLAATDPAGTAEWLLANPSEATQRRIDDVYNTWAAQDQQAALSAFASLPSGENRSNALRGLLTNLANQDPGAAVSMMDRYPSDVTDRVVQNVVWHSFGNDPATAVSQIARIADERERNRTYGRTISYWLEKDANAASAWLQSNPLPPAVQEEVNRRANRNR